ncbi:hypothetical protein HanRHA438_Chr05g0207951 [Helianthus annuus]|uniref:Uncharacterized protein n=1 Tax=Helianthus annuus TaxID=4232 RepID=A0A9K3IYX5_HELAN|nr:hypothetical protein HanXRQr2_Chr05g0198341 [Helianthus annuus]KAJ0569159.1 hypothetical protein HanHA300_Chr05g0162861 [Helianthus annuus]KAJ0575553.1 hypothetical protein HanIR_Chr05g0214041 [Helianthus annuus]KAJ0583455.1 hypothetical protein HanHA89_Chr05g0176751 [Helianthus annuus]KAJ0749195.1 hypothetical protein HanLR1_Chr05g0166991 [Helianthus annuus]
MGEVLTRYGLHISQISFIGLPRITHFEFICRAQHLIPSVDMFNVFYYVSCTGGFYSFNSRTANVLPCSKDPPKSLHDWKHKFFYIRRGMIPIGMHYRSPDEGIPKLPLIPYAEEQWYKTLIKNPTPMLQLDEKALVTTSMSMMWAPSNPSAAPIYGYKNKVGGDMVVRVLPEGERPWLQQIQDSFHHPTEESLSIHVATPTSAHPFASVKPESVTSPARGETILLSSEESIASFDGLIHRSRAALIDLCML